STLSSPLNKKRLKFMLCFILPKTASTSQHLCLRCAMPSLLSNRFLAFCLSLIRLWFRSMILLPCALWHIARSGHPLQFCARYLFTCWTYPVLVFLVVSSIQLICCPIGQ